MVDLATESRPRYSLSFRFAAFLVKTTLGRYLRVRCEGLENLPPGQPFILACNHRSTLDPVLLCAYIIPHIRAMISPAATKGLFVGPLGVLLRRMGSSVVDRQNNRNLGSVRQLLRTLKRRPILIFPEGGILDEGESRAGKLGVGFLAAKADVPIIPAAVLGTNRSLPKGGRWIKRARVRIRFGNPLWFSNQARARGSYEEITSKVMSVVLALETESHASERS